MKIIYAKKSSGIDEQGSFQNPEYYLKPELTAQSVVIYGHYPKIKADYDELGIDVEVRELSESGQTQAFVVNVGITPELQAVIDEAEAECEKVVAENSELTVRLEAITGERDALTIKTNELQAVIDGLNQTIAALEAKAKKPIAAEIKAAKTLEEKPQE